MSTQAKPDLRAKLGEVNEQITAKQTEAQQKWAAFEQARDEFAAKGGEVNRTDSDEFKKAEDEHKEFAAASEELRGLERVRDGIFSMIAGPGQGPAANNGNGLEPRQALQEAVETLASLGERATDSDAYRQLVASGALGHERMSFTSPLIKFAPEGDEAAKAMGRREMKAALLTGTSDTSGGAFIDNDRKAYVPAPRRPRRILDLITTGETGSDTVEYARQTTFTNVAAETAEATTTTTGTKPEATIAFEKVTAAVKTIAHWIPATRRSIADVPQLRTLIDSQLRYGLEYRLETQVVNGGGTGEDLTGILNTSNILTQAKSTDSVADAVHKAITQIRLGYIEPNGVAMHPNDWQIVRLSRDDSGAAAGTGGYLYGPPSTAGSETMWGLPVAVTASVPDDTALVGDFRQAVLWLREGMQVLATDSHDDFFIKNLIALLAEMRAAFGVLLPAAFCKVTSVD